MDTHPFRGNPFGHCLANPPACYRSLSGPRRARSVPRVSPTVSPQTGGVRGGCPTGCLRRVKKTLRGHSRDTFWTLRSGPGDTPSDTPSDTPRARRARETPGRGVSQSMPSKPQNPPKDPGSVNQVLPFHGPFAKGECPTERIFRE